MMPLSIKAILVPSKLKSWSVPGKTIYVLYVVKYPYFAPCSAFVANLIFSINLTDHHQYRAVK